MNDDFEQRLQRQPMRTVPSAWRDEILVAARAAVATNTALSEVHARLNWREWPVLTAGKLWRELFWPSRYAWGGFAAVWLTLLVANESIYDGDARTDARIAPSAEVIQAAQAQRRMLAELTGPLVEQGADRPRPHSRRNTELAFT